MKRFKNILKFFGLFVLVLLVFRGWIFRKSVNYRSISVRENVTKLDSKLIALIDKEQNGKELSITEIIAISDGIVKDNLEFTFDKCSNNPNQCFETNKANCVGYSALFNSVGNYLLTKQKINKDYKFVHHVGKLSLFGVDLHQMFENPFFKDHDFVEICDFKNEDSEFVDPTISDCFFINRVSSY